MSFGAARATVLVKYQTLTELNKVGCGDGNFKHLFLGDCRATPQLTQPVWFWGIDSGPLIGDESGLKDLFAGSSAGQL